MKPNGSLIGKLIHIDVQEYALEFPVLMVAKSLFGDGHNTVPICIDNALVIDERHCLPHTEIDVMYENRVGTLQITPYTKGIYFSEANSEQQ